MSGKGTRINKHTNEQPLYMQVADILLERIQSGELKPGDRLPAERALSQEMGVNRATLRQGLQVLALQGLLRREQGNGTFIAQPKLERKAAQVYRFTRGMQKHGLVPGTKLLSVEKRVAETSLAQQFGFPSETLVFQVARLRTIDEEPVMLERYTIPEVHTPQLDQHNLEERSIFEILATEYDITIECARQTLEPMVAGEHEAQILGVPLGTPIMLERRLSFDVCGRPVELGRDLYRGDRFRFLTESAPFEL